MALLSRLCLALLLSVPIPALASGPGAVRKQIESSMLVTGEVQINAGGQVEEVVIDQVEKLPEGVVGFVQEQVNGWNFEPVLVDDVAVPARSRMSLRVVGKPVDEDSVSIGIRHANFLGTEPDDGEFVSSVRMNPPRYPSSAAIAGVQANVYLILKVGQEGRVEEAVVEQVNLRIVASERDMEKWRGLFEKATLPTARKWTFAPPTKGEQVDRPYWVVRVPVEYTTGTRSSDRYGQWQAYVPGPRERASWDDNDDFAPDALVDGGVYMAGAGQHLRLLTPLQEG